MALLGLDKQSSGWKMAYNSLVILTIDLATFCGIYSIIMLVKQQSFAIAIVPTIA